MKDFFGNTPTCLQAGEDAIEGAEDLGSFEYLTLFSISTEIGLDHKDEINGPQWIGLGKNHY